MIIGQLTTDQIARRIGLAALLRRRASVVRAPAVYFSTVGFAHYGYCIEFSSQPAGLVTWAQARALSLRTGGTA